jgi:FMN phosphatase YigB (HAD superfamily)
MKAIYVFDTMGTTIPEQAVKELNESFFKHATQLGYSQAEVEELRARRQANPKDPKFLKRSGPGKAKLLENGLCTVKLYPDVKPAFESVHRDGSDVLIFTKGAQDLVTAIYRNHGLMEFIGEGNIISSTGFNIADKTNPACYQELDRLVRVREGAYIHCYMTDDVDEANACAEALERTPVFYVNRGQKRKKALNGPAEVKGLMEAIQELWIADVEGEHPILSKPWPKPLAPGEEESY